MNALLTWIGSLLILALAALFAGPHFVDWNVYRGVFEEEASRILGRDVRVGGDVNLRLLPAPYVRFEKLRISRYDGHRWCAAVQRRKLYDVAVCATLAEGCARGQAN